MALGLVLSASSDPLHSVSNQGRAVRPTSAMRKDMAENEYDVAHIRLYYMATRGSLRFYRFTTRKRVSCYGTADAGDDDLHAQLPKHPCSPVAVDAHGKVLWDIRHARPEF
jgi:hypothetical protein